MTYVTMVTISASIYGLEDDWHEAFECSEDDIDDMAEQLLDILDDEEILQRVYLSFSYPRRPSTAFAELVFPRLVTQVQQLEFSSFEFDNDLTTIFGQALSQNDVLTRHLTELSFRFPFDLSTHAALELSKGLSNNPQISILHFVFEIPLQKKKLEYCGAFHEICSSLPSLTSLTSLQMRCFFESYEREIPHLYHSDSQASQPTLAEALMIAITNHPTLLELDLQRFETDINGLKAIVRHLGNRHVQIQNVNLVERLYAHFPERNTDNQASKARNQMELDSIGEELIESLKSNYSLLHLNFRNISFRDWETHTRQYHLNLPQKIMDRIDFFIDLNKKGRRLLHHPNFSNIPPSLWCIILAGCRNNASPVFGLLGETTPNGNLLLVEIIGSEQTRKRKLSETMF